MDESRKRGGVAGGKAWHGKRQDSGHPLLHDPGKDGSKARLDPYVNIAVAITLQASRDLLSDDIVDTAEVLLWLGTVEADNFLEVLDKRSPACLLANTVKLEYLPGKTQKAKRGHNVLLDYIATLSEDECQIVLDAMPAITEKFIEWHIQGLITKLINGELEVDKLSEVEHQLVYKKLVKIYDLPVCACCGMLLPKSVV